MSFNRSLCTFGVDSRRGLPSFSRSLCTYGVDRRRGLPVFQPFAVYLWCGQKAGPPCLLAVRYVLTVLIEGGASPSFSRSLCTFGVDRRQGLPVF